MEYFKSAQAHNVPQSAWERNVKLQEDSEDCVDFQWGRKVVFSEQMEAMLAEDCLEMERKFFEITQKRCSQISL